MNHMVSGISLTSVEIVLFLDNSKLPHYVNLCFCFTILLVIQLFTFQCTTLIIKEEKYDEAVNIYRKVQRIYPNNIGICAGLAMVLALRNKPSDWDEALELCQKVLGEMQYEKIKTSLRTIQFIIMKNTMTRDEVFIQLKQLTHIWESREMITSELYEGEERNKYLKSLACLIISLLYSKIENGQMNDIEMLKMIYLGPKT